MASAGIRPPHPPGSRPPRREEKDRSRGAVRDATQNRKSPRANTPEMRHGAFYELEAFTGSLANAALQVLTLREQPARFSLVAKATKGVCL